ncbi:site-specific DNA-methyltransferase [Salinisphaera hydrothermalis]|uniref:site-specific DNA-methyltransferase (adenine-specific) n=1 Tax=Salinisphaera hydrothermalis (strain C41B8) TaxID=1304275 RepID=A0A084IG86_SALHC|nr:site-specific DNA-methyltransferase [Salinisphaera hydrothermalis]KEZ75720.1 adenine-specific DNA-methyltransferase [Salinisphaera hydrothermalis C41B8]
MTAQSTAFDQLRHLLKDMFQFEDHDLDFGVYRITRLKREFIQSFIDGDDENSLKHTVSRVLGNLHNSQNEASRNWLAAFAGSFGPIGQKAWEELEAAPDDPEKVEGLKAFISMPVVDAAKREQAEAQLKTFLETRQSSTEHLESRIYNHLLNFFDLYYANGDFGYNTRAASAFKVPYEADYDGSDTLFHWKHKGSYYIKSGNGFHSVRCEIDGRWLEFRLTRGGDEEAETGERNNNKDSARKHYRLHDIQPVEETGADGTSQTIWQVRFVLAESSTPKVELYPRLWQTVFEGDGDLTAYLHKKPDAKTPAPGQPVFNELGKDFDKADGGQTKGIGQLRLGRDKYLGELAKRDEFSDLGRNAADRAEALKADATAAALWQIDRNLNKFYVGNDADYFIHKDLGGFLAREKARFIKQVVFSDLDGLLHADNDNTTTLIARAFNEVADKLIGFLAAIENFQKNLFELKKKVVDTHWLISVGKIPEAFHARVFANEKQRREWRDVFKVDVDSVEQLAEHPTLVVDTSLYRESDPDFQDALLGDPAFDNLDEQTDGLLINSENWQALNLLQETFRERIKCIYIDPPYNTGGDGFLYKDSFRHSSWASMIHDRLRLAYPLLATNGVLFASIDDKERTQLELQLKQVFGVGNRVEELIWAQNSTKNQSPTYSTNHEYVEVFARDLETAKAEPAMFREPKPGYAEIVELVERLNPNYPSITEVEEEIDKLFEQHKTELKAELEGQGIKFEKSRDTWRGLYNYKNAEYRDEYGNLVSEEEARVQNASIWIWQSDNPAFPLGGGTANKPGVYDPDHPDYRFYKPPHPVTGGECPHPKSGWRFPAKPVEGLSTSFEELSADYRIAWGRDEKKVPRVKRFIHETETNVGQSVLFDYTDGEKELTSLSGQAWTFPNPKPSTLVERFAQQTTTAGEWIMDFFAGSGTTGHAVIRSDEQRRFLLTEMGGYFDDILIPRIKRVMYSTQWKDGAPVSRGQGRRMLKVQTLEQYEDVLDNLHPAWNDAALPEGVPVQYLFRPEHNQLTSSLDLSRPFEQSIRVGKKREVTSIDLMETWCYLEGHRAKSRRVYGTDEGFDRRYLAVETIHGTLVIFRDIDPAEDDAANLTAIIGRYVDDDGRPTVQRLEINFDGDLRRLDIETRLIAHTDFMRGTTWS